MKQRSFLVWFTFTLLMGTTQAQTSSLTEDERQILQNGEISDGSYYGGGAVGTLFGFGLGHAIQGRYMYKGLIFTTGELVSLSVMSIGLVDCVTTGIGNAFGPPYQKCNDGLMVTGLVAYMGLRVWEIIDVWAGGSSYNARYREIRKKADQEEPGKPEVQARLFLTPIVDPTRGSGGYGGVQLLF